MVNKEFIRIINEEISKFDFLNNDRISQQQSVLNVLGSSAFQGAFINDSLRNSNKIKANTTAADLRTDDINDDKCNFSIQYDLNVEYAYDLEPGYGVENPITFQMFFQGDRIRCNMLTTTDKGDYDTPDYTRSYLNSVDWGDISVSLYSGDDEEIKFIELEKPQNYIEKELFIKKYLKDIVAHKIADFR